MFLYFVEMLIMLLCS